MSSLSSQEPPDLPQPRITNDPRIEPDAIPKVGSSDVTERDVLILHAAARYFLETGEAKRIAYGSTDAYHPGRYFLNFGEEKNHFFSPADIPNLEERIRELMEQ